MIKPDNLIHLSAQEVEYIHDSILDQHSGLKGSRLDLSIDALIGRIHANLLFG